MLVFLFVFFDCLWLLHLFFFLFPNSSSFLSFKDDEEEEDDDDGYRLDLASANEKNEFQHNFLTIQYNTIQYNTIQYNTIQYKHEHYYSGINPVELRSH